MSARRAFVIVLDACGAGELPDSADYGDAGANTLGHVAEASGGLDVPVMGALGLGSALPLVGVPPSPDPVVHGRLHPQGPGKDTITGHWELMGAITPVALRTYPDGFPEEIVEQLIDGTGRGVLCNKPYSGTAVIDDFGEQHLETGDLIVYTSADSVLQIAAHVDEVPPAELYAACAAAREIMQGEHAVGRVIARPFRGEPGRVRAHGGPQGLRAAAARALLPARSSRPTGSPRHTVGKIGQVFAGVGVDHQHKGATNAAAIDADHGADGRARRRLRVHQPRGDRPGLRAPPGRRGLPRRAARDRRRPSAPGSRSSTRRATCSCSPPTTAATPRRPGRTTRASTSRCWPPSRAITAAATTARSPTSAPPCCAGWPAATPRSCPGAPFVP